MSWKEKLKEELKSLSITMLYFALWFGFMIVMKMLLLEEYNVEIYGLSMALIGALIVAKVILIVDHIPMGKWIEKQPAIIDILFRTFIYSIGIVIILILEKGFEARNEYGGFFKAVPQVFKHADKYHLYVNTLGVVFALLGFNFLSLIGKHLGEGGYKRILFSPPPLELKEDKKKLYSGK